MRYPVYIISKGRWKSRLTVKALDYMGVDYHVIVEEQELEDYASVIDRNKLLILPQSYKDEYDTFWERCDENKTGSGPARNYAWDHSIERGFKRHWLMDDNLDAFHRLNKNEKWECETSACFRAMEDFADRYTNLAICGPNYYSFCKTTSAAPAFKPNTRIYSCLLIENSTPFRWRGLYNEDTDLCLRVLKSGLCTVQFNAFLQGKVTTKRMSGGNTDELYQQGTKDKSQMLVDMHPDVARLAWKFNRWHHHVNYKPFANNMLTFRDDFIMPTGNNEYGMVLVDI